MKLKIYNSNKQIVRVEVLKLIKIQCIDNLFFLHHANGTGNIPDPELLSLSCFRTGFRTGMNNEKLDKLVKQLTNHLYNKDLLSTEYYNKYITDTLAKRELKFPGNKLPKGIIEVHYYDLNGKKITSKKVNSNKFKYLENEI